MWVLLADLAPTIIPIVILYFEVLGIFGNVNLILATVRKEHLRTKHGVLLALTSFYQLMCLLGELVNVGFALRGQEIKRNICFVFMSPYLIFSVNRLEQVHVQRRVLRLISSIGRVKTCSPDDAAVVGSQHSLERIPPCSKKQIL
ncbi:hypothetical protein Y032_0007g3227 [Ancylostoma ceylanicum]|uniref:G-protein coupled receptors family 1 profile domain-containing protein n=1 Tax=Ancylostoma ceylanicum TaxID=53326 RepID=A0A016VMB1_9BILA|nr:hypothetical protein Y032_0007g3227 [Ancylostoma ceylanicum]